jgi:AAA15 family ATPase/GTPase
MAKKLKNQKPINSQNNISNPNSGEIIYTNLRLKNFRCYNDFAVDGLKQITIFGGENNIGKSTLLEAIFLLYDRRSIDVFLKLNRFRGNYETGPDPRQLWDPLFANLDISKEITISLGSQNIQRTLTFKQEKGQVLSISKPKDNNVFPSGNNLSQQILTASYTDGTHSNNYVYSMSDTNLFINSENKTEFEIDGPLTRYIGRYVIESSREINGLFSNIIIANKKEHLLEILKLMDERIVDVYLVQLKIGNPCIYIKLSTGLSLPLSGLGMGTSILMIIVMSMLGAPGTLILIDEIETGFHHSFYPKLWKILFSLSLETSCQIIATTHNYEFMSAFNRDDYKANIDDIFAYFRLGIKDGEPFPFAYRNDLFEFATDNNLEIR